MVPQMLVCRHWQVRRVARAVPMPAVPAVLVHIGGAFRHGVVHFAHKGGWPAQVGREREQVDQWQGAAHAPAIKAALHWTVHALSTSALQASTQTHVHTVAHLTPMGCCTSASLACPLPSPSADRGQGLLASCPDPITVDCT